MQNENQELFSKLCGAGIVKSGVYTFESLWSLLPKYMSRCDYAKGYLCLMHEEYTAIGYGEVPQGGGYNYWQWSIAMENESPTNAAAMLLLFLHEKGYTFP